MSIIFERRRRAAPRNNVLASWSKLARTKRWLLPSPRSSLSIVLFVLIALLAIFLPIDGVFTELWQGSVMGCCEVSGHLIAGLKHIVFCFDTLFSLPNYCFLFPIIVVKIFSAFQSCFPYFNSFSNLQTDASALLIGRGKHISTWTLLFLNTQAQYTKIQNVPWWLNISLKNRNFLKQF